MRYFLFLIPLFLFLGCANKEFEPKKFSNENLKNKSLYKSLYDYTKDSKTFRVLRLKYVKKTSFIDDGLRAEYVNVDLNNKNLGKFKKVSKDLAAYDDKLLIIDENKTIKMPYMVYSATKNKNNIALVFENNLYGLYSLKQNKMLFLKKGDDVIAAKYLGARPLFYQGLILYPLLDGNIAVVDAKSYKFIRNIDISNDSIIDNIIFLKIVNNNLFMATPKKLVLFNPNFLIDYKDDIKHIISYKNDLYIFNVEGKIIKLDSNLKKLKEKNLPFADFFAPSVCKGNIYTLTTNGYLLKISPNLKIDIYKTNQFDTSSPLRIEGCKIYNQDKVFFIE